MEHDEVANGLPRRNVGAARQNHEGFPLTTTLRPRRGSKRQDYEGEDSYDQGPTHANRLQTPS